MRSDNGGEYINHQFQQYFQQNGLQHEISCSYTPQQNGILEWKNKHILETARALLTEVKVPKKYWTDAICTSVYLINRLPSRALNYQTPLQVLASYIPLPSLLMLPPRVFGSVAYVHIPKIHRTKLDPCAIKCVFLGYENKQKGYRCYDPTTRRLYTTMDVTFLETKMFFSPYNTHSSIQGETWTDDQNWVSENWIH